jgi:hypothetical protein
MIIKKNHIFDNKYKYQKLNKRYIMTKKLILLVLLFVSVISFSQTKSNSNKNTKLSKEKTLQPSKEATQQWIKEKIYSYSYRGNDIKYNFTITYDGNDIIIQDFQWDKILGDMNCTNRFPVIDIDFISFNEKAHVYWLNIVMKEGKETSLMCRYDGENEILKPDRTVTIILDISFKNNDLPERMTKAFKRLIELYGGKKATTKETF